MIISEYAIERELVNRFIEYTFTHPLNIEGEERRLFIWGHEILLLDGKGDYKAGILDLLATDEKGEVWLIEAKLCNNKEWTPAIWKSQVGPYAKSLMKRTEQEIALGARRYIVKESAGAVFPQFLPTDTSSLVEAFCHWAVFLGQDRAKGMDLYESTIRKIKSGEFIQCILSDHFNEEIWGNRPKASNSFSAYITFQENKSYTLYDKTETLVEKEERAYLSYGSWKSFMQRKLEIKPTPDKIPLLLADTLIPIYETILSFLDELNWNGNYKANQKGFIFDLPTIYGPKLRIHLGWIDADGQQHIRFRTPYQYGLKFNIDFRYFKREADADLWKAGYGMAAELAKTARYNTRGGEFEILNPYWTAEKVRDLKWDGEMYRFISKSNRDYIGLEEEQQDLENVFKFLRKVIVH
ncbi:hypothetical protein QWY22_15010 [Planococcus liqunii]|uniref:hypothetical protein n=1 Tax=Planococcus liqunii TaxID=3058394 RepID=UPI0026334F41|nr:hypothetical protein [Planococcus sp. N056]WKA50199.1 hypothetical protein QWY22_15010 [Planococcus sp. N056]